MYKALVRFADLRDNGHIYEAGEIYPRLGLDVTPERIAELAGSDNRMGYPLIRAETAQNGDSGADVESIGQSVETPQKRSRGRKKGA